MNTARGNVARPARDGNETPRETPVIPIRPGLTEQPAEPPAAPLDGARRRAEALRLSRDENLSLREIGKRLGIGKDAVSRDIKAALREEADRAAEVSRDTGETSPETGDTADKTPAAPRDGDHDTLVLVLDEPLRQALAVLRSTRGGADTPEQNARVARAAIRATADTVLDARQHAPGRSGS